MPESSALSLAAAQQFSDKYSKAKSERQLAQSFWRDFFTNLCGISDLIAAGIEFEHPVRAASGSVNFIDVLWPGVVLIEHKSAGKDLDEAEKQARGYLAALDPKVRPPNIIVSDFKRIRIVDVLAGESVDFDLADLPSNVTRFDTLLGPHASGAARVEVAADKGAAELMGQLFVEFEAAGYTGHAVSVFLVRVLFLMFGDDTRMWKRGSAGLFEALVASTPEDGSGLGGTLQELFQVLDTDTAARPSTTPPSMSDFPHVNGGLFAETLLVFSFTREMRAALVNASKYDWATISPAIFGAMFQEVKSKELRRELGEHYTSEANILKLIAPLFLTELTETLRKAWEKPIELRRLRERLTNLTFFDPACGCGNFLLVAYKRIRELEMKIIARLQELGTGVSASATTMHGHESLGVYLGQFHGIEYEEWSSQIATVAMFLADHQMNLAMEALTGESPDRFPLTDSAHIVHGNALTVDWAAEVPMGADTYIMGNPPFIGSSLLSDEQKEDRATVWARVSGHGNVDYVACWFLLAARHMAAHGGQAAFVATNSITQGQQPPVIWGELSKLGMGIDFAHQTFAWANDASNKAAVHCVIIGFSAKAKSARRPLWTYATPKSDPTLASASNINAYLLDAPNVLVTERRTPLVSLAQKMDYGNKPADGGALSDISPKDAADIRASDPLAARFLRRIVGAREMLHDEERFCLWLEGATPSEINGSPVLRARVRAVMTMRAASKKAATRDAAKRPAEFQEIRQPTTDYLVVPRHSSSDRDYVPVARFDADVIVTDAVSMIADPSLMTFGVIESRAFTLWNRAVSGRIKSDTRISGTITYNNFPFPDVDDKARREIEKAAQAVLDARAAFPTDSLAVLYDPVSMPPALRAAHDSLDGAVLRSYGLRAGVSDERVVTVLFERYAALSGGLLAGS